jgi:glycosyltransferase involved in cell wall biosynthesis
VINEKYSVLMSVYHKENPQWMEIAINSMLNQTVKPDEIILMVDGPIGTQLQEVINKFEKQKQIRPIYIEKNVGLGLALQRGINECKNELIARMDTDDYSAPNRIEEELKCMKEDKDLGMVGTNVEEFNGSIDNVVLPETDEQIKQFCKSRNPFRHPSILYKKAAVLKAGNYRDYYLFEDYDMWNRMIRSGCKCYNIQKPLTYMRVNDDFYMRRGGPKYLKSILKFKKEQLDNGDINKKDYIKAVIVRTCVCLAPNKVRDIFYRKFLRK